MLTRPLRVAVAGLGFMGKTHLHAWSHVDGAELAAIVTADPRKLSGDLSTTGGNLETAASQFDFTGLQRYSRLEDALADPTIDAVDLCLPTHLHAEAGLAALRAGKHVLLEKPLARTSPEAYALIGEAAHSGRTLMAGHVLRFFPEWQELHRHVSRATTKLGSFRRNCASPTWSPWLNDPAKSGGAPLDLLIHDADFALHCFGLPSAVSAQGVCDPAARIDWLTARLTFPKSGPVEITGGWHPSPAYPFSMEFNFLTEAGTLDWSSAGRPLTLFPSDGPAAPIALAPSPDPWVAQFQYFTSCARAGRPPTLCPPAESAHAVRLIELIIESRNRNGEIIPWTN